MKTHNTNLSRNDIKFIFQTITQLNFVPKNLWSKVTLLFDLKEADKGEILLREGDESNKWYFILKGQLKTTKERTILPGDYFGSIEAIGIWEDGDVVVMEKSSLIIVPTNELSKILIEASNDKYYKEFLSFLADTIFGFNDLGEDRKSVV